MHFLLNYAEPCEKFVDNNKAQQKKIVIFYIEIYGTRKVKLFGNNLWLENDGKN